jgi:hypothetical protein
MFLQLPEIDRQWVVEAHRAGPLTLAVHRLSGMEAPSGGIQKIETLVVVSDCPPEVNHGQEHKDKGLND